MPEYQLTLAGIGEVATFYKEIFRRQKIRSLKRSIEEFTFLDSTIVEIGTFTKEYTNTGSDSLLIQNGKYWNIWNAKSHVNYKLKGEVYGYFHPIDHPEALIVQLHNRQPDEAEISIRKKIPFELKAYNALMEKGVKNRDGILRSMFFMNDARVMPFADSTVNGIEKIRPYLIAYSNRGHVSIDSIMCYTYDFENAGDFILEYDMFKVKWSVPEFSGKTEGKGIRIWKRQEDKSLRLYREIGTHNFPG